MGNAKAAAERLRREQEEQQQKAHEAATQDLKLQAGIRPFWRDLQAALRRELDDFKEGAKPLADQLQEISLNENSFGVHLAGLRILEIVLYENEQMLQSEYISEHSQKAQLSFEYDSIEIVTLDGYTADEGAGRLLAPLFRSFQVSK